MQVPETTLTGPRSLQPWELTEALAAEEYVDIALPEEPATFSVPREAQAAEASPVLRIVLPEEAPSNPVTVEPSGRIWIEKEEFQIEWDDDQVRILHDRWSLCGFGETLLDAQLDFISEARDLGSVMADMDLSTLSEEARRLRAFALRFLTVTPLFAAHP